MLRAVRLAMGVTIALLLLNGKGASAQIPLDETRATVFPALPAPLAVSLSRVTFTGAHTEMAYFLRVTSSEGVVAECFTPCTLELPAGKTHIAVVAPRTFARDIELSGRPTLVKVSHFSSWRYGVGGLLLGISLAEFIYGAVYFPWTGDGVPRDAAISAVAWAFGGLELTSAMTLLALGGRNRIDVIDSPSQLKAALQKPSALRLAGIGAFLSPSASGLHASFRF